MKYRIKTITYKDSSIKYTVEYNYWIFFWNYVEDPAYPILIKFNSREEALQALDIHFTKCMKNKEQSIQIEYINK